MVGEEERLDNGDSTGWLQRENNPAPGTLITLLIEDDLLLVRYKDSAQETASLSILGPRLVAVYC